MLISTQKRYVGGDMAVDAYADVLPAAILTASLLALVFDVVGIRDAILDDRRVHATRPGYKLVVRGRLYRELLRFSTIVIVFVLLIMIFFDVRSDVLRAAGRTVTLIFVLSLLATSLVDRHTRHAVNRVVDPEEPSAIAVALEEQA